LKPCFKAGKGHFYKVAPRAGAWIETGAFVPIFDNQFVAPRAGAWIETSQHMNLGYHHQVAPRAGAWIETLYLRHKWLSTLCRPPRGGVD